MFDSASCCCVKWSIVHLCWQLAVWNLLFVQRTGHASLGGGGVIIIGRKKTVLKHTSTFLGSHYFQENPVGSLLMIQRRL